MDNFDIRAKEGDRDFEKALRPSEFDSFSGQDKIVENLKIFVAAARMRGESLDHILFHGPPGLGKTTLSGIIANELGKGNGSRFMEELTRMADKNGWILGYSVHPGNQHDSRTFKALYDKIKEIGIKTLVADAGYKTPAIAKLLIDDGITPLLPYKRPMTKEGFFRKHEYVYDEYYDCYICPNNQILTYSTTNRSGYREYKSCGTICAGCPYLSQCTESKDHVKVVIRHIWEPYMEMCEDIRQTLGMKELYSLRKETIERIFGTAKENHGFRYTQMLGKARMEMKVGLTFACMNLKKLAKIKAKRGLIRSGSALTKSMYTEFAPQTLKALPA